jgi:hypothetical protein
MPFALTFALATVLMVAPPTKTRDQMKASYDAHRSDFDYLLGDWEFTADSQQWGKFRGGWSAMQLGSGGPILDEYRVLDDKGETMYATTTLRTYNALLDQWELVSTDAGTGLQNAGTAHREGTEMIIDQKFGYGSPNPSMWHIRYHDIQADRFSWAGDRSTDGGKTWTKNFQTIEAHRVGPARSLRLAPVKNTAP